MGRTVRETASSQRSWLLAFLLGVLSPALAVVIKPVNFSFYMFLPAEPSNALDRFRLLAGNALLVAGLLLSALAAIRLCALARRRRKWAYLFLPAVVLFHPFFQPVFLESLDTSRGAALARHARDAGIVGMRAGQVRTLLGEPTVARTNIPGTLTWEYKQLPAYWVGSYFQVFFKDGVVAGIEPNDD